MNKIKVSSDTILQLLQGLMENEEVNYTITDTTAPYTWQNKTVQKALNVEYYTFKHRPMDTEVLVKQMIQQGQHPSAFQAFTRSFGLLSLTNVERIWSKDIDTVTVSASLEYWVQTEKVKLLEDMFEDLTILTNGERIPVQIGTENRQALIVFDKLQVEDIQKGTEFGEMAVCSVDITIGLAQNVYSKTEYEVDFLLDNTWVKVPIGGIVISNEMNQESVPYVNNASQVGNLNLSKVKVITIAFDGLYNEFIDSIVNKFLTGELIEKDGQLVVNTNENDNNEQLIMRLTRGMDRYFYDCVVKTHSITAEGNNNEVHSLTLTTRGL